MAPFPEVMLRADKTGEIRQVTYIEAAIILV